MCAQHCDSVVMKKDETRWELSAVSAQLTSEEVTLSVDNSVGWNIIFDREPTKVGLTLPGPFLYKIYSGFNSYNYV